MNNCLHCGRDMGDDEGRIFLKQNEDDTLNAGVICFFCEEPVDQEYEPIDWERVPEEVAQ